jgi:hypothetical protein
VKVSDDEDLASRIDSLILPLREFRWEPPLGDDLMLGDTAQQTVDQMPASEKARRLSDWDRYGMPSFAKAAAAKPAAFG